MDNALLNALQRRLVAMAEFKHSLPNEVKEALQHLIAQLYQAQQQGHSVLTLSDCQTAIDIEKLRIAVPEIIGENPHTPIAYFPPFIAFRRDFRELLDTANFLSNSNQSLSPPTSHALQTINWSVNAQHTLSKEQQLAALTAATLPFSIITGGAGTGKTSTLTKALELILLSQPQSTILLAAPTGKAAYRLNESLQQQLSSVNHRVAALLSKLSATTLHRLLGVSEHSGRSYHHAGNPLHCDVLAIDEASMVSGDWFLRIRQALRPQSKIILLGDANQLPPIDGTPFFNEVSRLPLGYSQDFCHIAHTLDLSLQPQPTPLPNAICHLTVSHRFDHSPLIRNSATAVLNNQKDTLLQQLNQHKAYFTLTQPEALYHQLIIDFPNDRQTWLQSLKQRMILCAYRQGVFGSESINRYLDNHFRQQFAQYQTADKSTPWYVGRRVMVTQNDYSLEIYNGDIGYCEWDDNQHRYVICFDNKRRLAVELLENHITVAFAITIHKSQGSEYPHIDIVLGSLGAEHEQVFISQSLLYTAITRAKEQLRLFADTETLNQALTDCQQPLSPLLMLMQQQGESESSAIT